MPGRLALRWCAGANDDTDLLAQAIEEGATAANATVKSIEVAVRPPPASNVMRDRMCHRSVS